MRKALFLILFAFSISVKGQVLISLLLGDQLNSGKMEFGLVAGANFSGLQGMDNSKLLPTFGMGMYLDVNHSKNWVSNYEINLKTTLGARNITVPEKAFPIEDSIINNSKKSERKINVIQVPACINYRFENGFGFGVGIYASLQRKIQDRFFLERNETEVHVFNYFNSQLFWFDAGLNGNVHYRYPKGNGWQIKASVNYGMVDVFNSTSQLSATNYWFRIAGVIPIRLGLKKK